MTREKRLRLINQDMELFGPLPSDYGEFVQHGVMKHNNYMFYEKKKKICYCTGCRNDIHMDNLKLKHNSSVVCPCCGRIEIAKSLGYSRKNLRDIEWAVIIEKEDKNTLIRYVRHIKTYKNYRVPKIKIDELFRTIFTEAYSKAYGLYNDGWANYRQPFGFYPTEFKEPVKGAYIYNLDVKKSLDGTINEHSGCECIVEHYKDEHNMDYLFMDKHIKVTDAYCVERYLNDYRKAPYLEQLAKVGLFSILGDYHIYNSERHIARGNAQLHEKLKLTKGECKMLLKIEDPKIRALDILHKANDLEINLSQEQFEKLYYDPEINNLDYENILELMKYMTFHKAVKWLMKDKAHYHDYIMMCVQLGYDLSNKSVKFPKDIKKAHDAATDDYNSRKKKVLRLNLRKIIASGIYNFEFGKLQIVVPTSSRSIVTEGQKLRHCVARYVDQVANGETMILFVRKKDSLETPFYTLEWKNGQVKQCYGLKDCEMTPEVKLFTEKFKEHMEKAHSGQQIA